MNELDKDELMYTRILNNNATPMEITDYIDELHKEINKYKKAFIKKREYAEELEKDLFENCENYVVNKSTIKKEIEELDKEIQEYHELRIKCAATDCDYYEFVANTTAKIILQKLLKGESK